jgi:hypothetical protein
MRTDTITLSAGDLLIDNINGIIGFLAGIEEMSGTISDFGEQRLKCWRVVWVGISVPVEESCQSWTEIGLLNIIEAGGFEHHSVHKKEPSV